MIYILVVIVGRIINTRMKAREFVGNGIESDKMAHDNPAFDSSEEEKPVGKEAAQVTPFSTPTTSPIMSKAQRRTITPNTLGIPRDQIRQTSDSIGMIELNSCFKLLTISVFVLATNRRGRGQLLE